MRKKAGTSTLTSPDNNRAIRTITLIAPPTAAQTAEKILKYLNEYEAESAETPLQVGWEHMQTSRGWK